MNTYIKTIHEERSNENRVFGALLNYNYDENFNEVLFYTYHKDIYIFFDTMINMFDYVLSGDKKMKRAYMEECDFDNLYDMQIEGKFNEQLKWS